MMRFRSFILLCSSTLILASLLGCAVFGGGQVSGVNWALAINGGRVSAFSEEAEHLASTLVNGVTSSEGWDQGEGWQAAITVNPRSRSRRARRDAEEGNWVVIELAQPVTVNHVTLHSIDSEEYPAKSSGVRSLLVQYELETASKEMIWATANRYGKKIGDSDNIIRDNESGVIDVRFEPVKTQKIRLLIYSTNNLARADETSTARQGLIRLTEIEVYGMGKPGARDDLENLFNE